MSDFFDDFFDELFDHPGVIIVIIFLLVLALLGFLQYWETKHPCLKYGPPYQQTSYVKIGNIMVPETSTVQDCLVRSGVK